MSDWKWLEEIEKSPWPIRDCGESKWVDHRDCIIDREDFNHLIACIKIMKESLESVYDTEMTIQLGGAGLKCSALIADEALAKCAAGEFDD